MRQGNSCVKAVHDFATGHRVPLFWVPRQLERVFGSSFDTEISNKEREDGFPIFKKISLLGYKGHLFLISYMPYKLKIKEVLIPLSLSFGFLIHLEFYASF